ncbi:MAG: cyclic nucleotide-binding domain-containing protein [Elusimicrobiota bacterium]|nr:cyclic nucleotide-binding domain-containing protein [Elusimicrobiota bacterium]
MIGKLKKVKLFAVFPEDILRELVPAVVMENYREGEMVFEEGSQGNAVYIINKGRVQILKEGKILGVFSEGEVFGEMALYEEEKRSASARALSELALLKISNSDFKKFIREHPDFGVNFLLGSIQEMSARLRKTSQYFVTVFETGKIVGGHYSVNELIQKIIGKIIGDVPTATGGLAVIKDSVTDTWIEAASENNKLINFERAVELIEKEKGNIYISDEGGKILGLPIVVDEDMIGYIFVENSASEADFKREEEIILSSVCNQVGLGVVNALKRQEEENRKRLEEKRTWKY